MSDADDADQLVLDLRSGDLSEVLLCRAEMNVVSGFHTTSAHKCQVYQSVTVICSSLSSNRQE